MTYVRESSVEKYFVALAVKYGWAVRKLQWVNRAGAPDRIILKHYQRLVFVELKAPRGVLAPHQEREHERLRAMGFEVVVLWDKQMVETYFNGT